MYVNWKLNLYTQLEGYAAWINTMGDEEKPAIGMKITTIQDWETQANKEKVLLIMTVNDNIILHICDCNISTKTWNTLKELYENKKFNQVLLLKSKLMYIKMEENENANYFILRIK